MRLWLPKTAILIFFFYYLRMQTGKMRLRCRKQHKTNERRKKYKGRVGECKGGGVCGGAELVAVTYNGEGVDD